ncbi:MAG: M14 family zinc carboxypeptidase [Thermoplasmata archaeon]
MRTGTFAVLAVAAMLLCLFPAQPPDTVMASRSLDFGDYSSYLDIRAEMERISTEYSDIISMKVLGRTWEGRDIIALRLTDAPGQNEPGEPAILIMGGHHGNELASVEVPMYILDFLTENYADNATVKGLVDSRDIWFVPLVNPDGREYALNHDPAWRKNRRPIDADGDGTIDATGVDINRNYGHLWGELPGASHDPASGTYCGPHAFSENETIALGNLMDEVDFSVSLSYHTYGNVIYYPWNNNIDTASPKANLLEAIGQDLGALTGYAPMNGVDAYPTTGDSDDWLYAETDCLPFTIEMGTQYVTPPDELESLCARNLGAALHAMEIAAEPERALLPEWTVMVYMSSDADAGLANEAFKDINEMEVAGSTSDVNIIALYDGITNGDSCIYRIQKDAGGLNTAIISPTINDGGAVIDPATGELDMSDPVVLRSFVGWATGNYPAQKYLLAFWGHGDGVIKGFIPDRGKRMMVKDLRGALGGFSLGIVGFDTCSMGHFEVAAELSGIAEILIGSEAEEPMAGWNYAASLTTLVQGPLMQPEELARTIVSDYLGSNYESYLTQAAIDLAVFRDRLVPALGDFVNVSLDFAYPDHEKIWGARNFTDTFVAAQDAVDLFEFLGNLAGRNVSAPVLDRANRILELRDELVIFSGTGSLHPEATTMAVYFPLLENPVSGQYSGLEFLETGWGGFILGIKDPPARPVLQPVPPQTSNNTLGPYRISTTMTGAGAGPFTLFYRPKSGEWASGDMVLDGQGIAAEIPGHANGTVIEYYILDVGSNITEPYEVKWGIPDYFTLTVFAVCDISLSWAGTPASPQLEGNITYFSVNCSNAGPEPVALNITLSRNGTAGFETIGSTSLELGVGEHRIIEFNWTAQAGNWLVAASVSGPSAFDPDPAGHEATVWLNVTGTAKSSFFADYGIIIALLAVIWGVFAVLVLQILRKSRRRRRGAAARSIAAATDFLATAKEFGGDITVAEITLARAEDALSRNALTECEGLVSRARESAMAAVGERGDAPR